MLQILGILYTMSSDSGQTALTFQPFVFCGLGSSQVVEMVRIMHYICQFVNAIYFYNVPGMGTFRAVGAVVVSLHRGLDFSGFQPPTAASQIPFLSTSWA
jgi:hypothetical protein